MSKTIRRLLIGAGILLGTLVALVIGISLFFDVNRYKPQIEKAVAQSTGMKLTIQGTAAIKGFPKPRITLNDVHLSHAGSELLNTKELEIWPQVVPFLLHRKVVVDQVSLVSPKIHIEKSASGRMNYQAASPSAQKGPSKSPEIGSIRIKNGDLTYQDAGSGQTIEAGGLNAGLSGISWNGQAADKMKSLTFHGTIEAQSLKVVTKKGTRTASNLKGTVRDDHGLIRLDPTEMRVFGGVARGNAQIDLRGATPKIEITQTASGIQLDQAAPTLKEKFSGSVDGSMKLTASGKSVQAITKTVSGTVSLHSQNIATSVDIDALADKLDSAQAAQAMDLVGLGASLFSGLTEKASEQAGKTAGGAAQPKTAIRHLTFDWNIHQGIASAKDVAFATDKTTVAFQGDLNLIEKKYQKFQIATVDQNGCAKNKLEVEGPLNRPKPVAGSGGKQLSESFLGSAGSKVAELFGGKEEPKTGTSPPPEKGPEGCDLFYSGSAVHTG